jgi:hypothetical protein
LSPVKKNVTQLEWSTCIVGERQTDKLYPFLVLLLVYLEVASWHDVKEYTVPRSMDRINRDEKKA